MLAPVQLTASISIPRPSLQSCFQTGAPSSPATRGCSFPGARLRTRPLRQEATYRHRVKPEYQYFQFPIIFPEPHLVIMRCCHMAFLFGYTMAKPSANQYVWSLPVALSPTAEHALKHTSTGRQNFFQCFDNFIFY